ncbi:hypothetical protein APHAL10511_003591 [Amanita phalloides]|nr:hypothetical protein APHAL10511_003591 [Amanita phalloides]
MAEPNAAIHISAFFANYADFDYNPFAPVSSEFRRLKDHYGWERHSGESKDVWSDFSAAMGTQFATYYGSNSRIRLRNASGYVSANL